MSRITYLLLVIAGLTLLLSACAEEDDAPETLQSVIPEKGVTQQEAGDATEGTDEPAPDPTEAEVPPEDEPASEPPEQSFAGEIPAPEFPAGLDWLNTERPLTFADLRGKVVLLDFWTYGCINCMHIIPELKALEEKYAEELIVIGVHSAKFENEGETDNIRQIIQRYELHHPVVNDNRFEIWSEYGARAWPTLVIIDPDGNVLGYHAGEDIYDRFDFIIGGMIEQFDELGRIDRTPIEVKIGLKGQVDSPLLFPGKVLADEEGRHLYIADTNHNRVVVADLQGNVLEVIGDGQAALQDGSFETASFNKPQGLTLDGRDNLYVADTENHAIRRVDLEARSVVTVAGTGQQQYLRANELDPVSSPLNSPWDVLYVDGLLYIAMAGQHQIWVFDPTVGSFKVYAGSGREELQDGGLLEGGLNQPSGLTTDGRLLYIADSEASAIRTADLDPEGQLDTIVGTGLFDFGDADGIAGEVRLQHPLGIAYHEGLLYVADTYNSKIKIVDPDKRKSLSYLGGDEAGWRDGQEALFDEPGGVSIGGGILYIADTNNHVIRTADLEDGEVRTLVLVDMQGLLTRQPAGEAYSGKTVELDAQQLKAGDGTVLLEVILPDGYKVNDLAPFSMEWSAGGDFVEIEPEWASRSIVEPEFPLSFPAQFRQGDGTVTAELVIYYCEEEAQSLCFIERVRISVPVQVADVGDSVLTLQHEILQAPVNQ